MRPQQWQSYQLEILANNKDMNKDPLDIPNSVKYVSAARDSELSDDTDLNELFFVQLFP
jgi:hypothetical protein